MNLILSYPRCGSTFFKYCLELFAVNLGNVNLAHLSGKNSRMFKSIGMYGVTRRQHIIQRPHIMIENLDAFILILRNYKNCIPRNTAKRPSERLHFKSDMPEQLLLDSITGGTGSNNYIGNIIDYENFNGPKMVVYYEDFINNRKIKNILKKSLILFGQEDKLKHLDEFMSNVEKHRGNGKTIYRHIIKQPSYTGGKPFNYSDILNLDEQKWDAILEKGFPTIYSKYLARYKQI